MKYTELPCVKRLLSTKTTQGKRNKMARQLAIACKKDNIKYKHALNSFGQTFYRECSKRDFSFMEVRECFVWAYWQEHVLLHCPTIIKEGYCNDKSKSQCELYHRKKKNPTRSELRDILKTFMAYMKEVRIYKRHTKTVPNILINHIAGIHQKTIRSILFDELECQTVTYRGKPIDEALVKKEQIAEHQRWLELKKGWEIRYADQIKRQKKSIAPILNEVAEHERKVKEEESKKVMYR